MISISGTAVKNADIPVKRARSLAGFYAGGRNLLLADTVLLLPEAAMARSPGQPDRSQPQRPPVELAVFHNQAVF